MADNDSITIVGTVGFDPEYKVDGNGLPRATFRVASDQWQKNRESGAWERSDPNWYSVVVFRYLATNVAASVHKGERVIVTGNLKLHEWLDGGVKRVRPEIVASSVGHDLNWGTSSYTRPVKSMRMTEDEQPTSGGDEDAAAPMALERSEPEGDLVSATPEPALPF
jgi:single stranded DNA-binding protein (ssb)